MKKNLVDDLTFRRLDASAALANASLVQRIYEESYVNAIAGGHEFDSIDAFMNRFDAYARTLSWTW
jgi:hypothetical protein